MSRIKPTDAAQITAHLERTCFDVAFYNGQLVFCDFVDKNKDSMSEWASKIDLSKTKYDAEIYVYNIVPEQGGVFEIYERKYSELSKGQLYNVVKVIERKIEGFNFGFVCLLKMNEKKNV